MEMMKIEGFAPIVPPSFNATETESIGSSGGAEGFASYLKNSIGEVNELLGTADRKSMEMAAGKSENLHDAMISVEKAETALKLMMQVRNKAIEAYNEVMRMQL